MAKSAAERKREQRARDAQRNRQLGVATMNLELAASERGWIEQGAQFGGFDDQAEYLLSLVRADLARQGVTSHENEKHENVTSHEGSPVHLAFGCSRASWFLTPRVVLEAMPVKWQRAFVGLMTQLDETLDWESAAPPLAVFQVNEDGDNPETPPEHFNNYRRPNQGWLEQIKRGDP